MPNSRSLETHTMPPQVPNSDAERLISYLHASSEQEKVALARHLHDDLGGMLVGALMDIAWVEQHLPALTREAREKLLRARQSLGSAIDLKRSVIEKLRPTLLDNVGLFSALRWQVKECWGSAGLNYAQTYPPSEPVFREGVAIVLFRIAQQGLLITAQRAGVSSPAFDMRIENETLTMSFTCDGESGDESADERPSGLVSLEYRVSRLGGSMRSSRPADRPFALTIQLPLQPLTADLEHIAANH